MHIFYVCVCTFWQLSTLIGVFAHLVSMHLAHFLYRRKSFKDAEYRSVIKS